MNDQIFTDHPHPNKELLGLMSLFGVGFLAGIPALYLWDLFSCYQGLISIIAALFTLILIYGFWILHNTVYTLGRKGITVKFGSSVRTYGWSEFSMVSRRRGLFALKIGWLGMTPCVRMRDALVFKRITSRIPLYLTPSDPTEFLEEIRQLEPQLLMDD